jgi:hypothetical protein
MRYSGLKLLLFVFAVLLFSGIGFAQSDENKEPAARLELGVAPGWNLSNSGESSWGPSFSIEFTPIQKWLEIEAGTSLSFSAHSTEWGTEILFKKPWDITRTVEVMAGIGPVWINTRTPRTNSLAAAAALDFMFWRTPAHRVGWFFEPEYEHSFQSGHEKSLGFSIGLLLGIGP